jgi:hypothetical protein
MMAGDYEEDLLNESRTVTRLLYNLKLPDTSDGASSAPIARLGQDGEEGFTSQLRTTG